MAHFVRNLEKKKRYDIETMSIDGVSNKENFYGKSCRKCAPKVDLFRILVNNPKQPLHARNYFKSKIF